MRQEPATLGWLLLVDPVFDRVDEYTVPIRRRVDPDARERGDHYV